MWLKPSAVCDRTTDFTVCWVFVSEFFSEPLKNLWILIISSKNEDKCPTRKINLSHATCILLRVGFRHFCYDADIFYCSFYSKKFYKQRKHLIKLVTPYIFSKTDFKLHKYNIFTAYLTISHRRSLQRTSLFTDKIKTLRWTTCSIYIIKVFS